MSPVVDVISDVICPWCYIGKRRLESAIAAFETQQVIVVQWHPYQLNPTMPKEGISRRDYRSRKFGSWERSMELDARVEEVGQAEGVQFDFDKIEKTPNTVDAHRLIGFADQHDLQDTIVERLFHAYFTNGQDIGRRQTLLDLASDSGLDRLAVNTMLESEEGRDVVANGIERSRRSGIDGVPVFIINNEITLTGAQSSELFVEAFRRSMIA